MAILDYQALFADHHQGNARYIHILSKATPSYRDAAISDDDRDKLQDALSKSSKHQGNITIFYGTHSAQKSVQLNQLAYQSGRTVCLIDCAALTSKYIGETEKNIAKLIAVAENKNWILFFDEADALFARPERAKDPTTPQEALFNISDIMNHLSQYKGMTILNIQQKRHVSQLEIRCDYLIVFDH